MSVVKNPVPDGSTFAEGFLESLQECVQALDMASPGHPALARAQALLAWHRHASKTLAALEAHRIDDAQSVADVFE